MIVLRPYQNEIIEQARQLMKQGCRSILIQAPTGSGKTALTAHMLKTAAARGMSSFFVVHRRELVLQSSKTFDSVGLSHGIIASGFYEDRGPLVQIASIQTLARRYERFRRPKLIIIDEAHHAAAASWDKVLAHFGDAFHIGLTATPERLDGTGLGKWFKEMIHGPSVRWLIGNKFLSDYVLYAPPQINTEGVHTRMGDFVQSELAAAVDKPTITGDAIKHYQRLAFGKRAIVFAVSVEHSKHVVGQFNAAGIPAVHVDGETDGTTRDDAMRKFRSGEVWILSNVDLFGEGVDVPGIECIIALRPTQSKGLYLQQVGRSLRPATGKSHAIILDHAGNFRRHGLPDEERTWSLEGNRNAKGSSEANGPPIRVCSRCFATAIRGKASCSFCGFTFAVEAREVKQVAGELTEIKREDCQDEKRKEQGRAQTREQLLAVAKSRGYKNPHGWVHFIMQARQRKKLHG